MNEFNTSKSSNNHVDPPTRRTFLAGALGHLIPPDRSFATTIADLSDRETGPAADNLVSNEDSYPRVAPALARLVPEGSAYLGVGPDQNLTYVAHARPRLAFILDHRRRNVLLHLLHKALMTAAPDRATYLSMLTAREPTRPIGPKSSADEVVAAFKQARFNRDRLVSAVAEVKRVLRPLGVVMELEWADLATIASKLAGPGLDARFLALRMYPTFEQMILARSPDGKPAHFLADESLYRSIRDAQRSDRIVPIVGDFSASTALPRLGDYLRAQHLSIGLIYVSDVEFFLLRSGKLAAYAANLARLPLAEGAILVRSSTREIKSPDRIPGDSTTTIIRPIAPFLDDVRNGKIGRPDDLFRAP